MTERFASIPNQETFKDLHRYINRDWSLEELTTKVAEFNRTPPDQNENRRNLLRPFFNAKIVLYITIEGLGSFRSKESIDREESYYQLELMLWGGNQTSITSFKLGPKITIERSKDSMPPIPKQPVEPKKVIDLDKSDVIISCKMLSHVPGMCRCVQREMFIPTKKIPISAIKLIKLESMGKGYHLIIQPQV